MKIVECSQGVPVSLSFLFEERDRGVKLWMIFFWGGCIFIGGRFFSELRIFVIFITL